MAKTYILVKKETNVFRNMKADNKSAVIPVGAAHALIPAPITADFGNKVSHAKNRTRTRRVANMRVLHMTLEGQRTALRLSNRDLRSYKRLTAEVQAEA